MPLDVPHTGATHAQGFRTAEEVQRFSDMMDEMCYIVATKHSGSLKARVCLGRARGGESSSPCVGVHEREMGLTVCELCLLDSAVVALDYVMSRHTECMVTATCTLPGTPGAYVGTCNRAGGLVHGRGAHT